MEPDIPRTSRPFTEFLGHVVGPVFDLRQPASFTRGDADLGHVFVIEVTKPIPLADVPRNRLANQRVWLAVCRNVLIVLEAARTVIGGGRVVIFRLGPSSAGFLPSSSGIPVVIVRIFQETWLAMVVRVPMAIKTSVRSRPFRGPGVERLVEGL